MTDDVTLQINLNALWKVAGIRYFVFVFEKLQIFTRQKRQPMMLVQAKSSTLLIRLLGTFLLLF